MKKELGEVIKKDFPIFQNNKGLVFLDSGASTQKPKVVIDAIVECYEQYYANVHRGIYQLSERASDAYENVREKTQKFINADSTQEIIFTRNATESINLVAYAWGRDNITSGDEILITEMEHHANIVPWQQLVKEKGAELKYVPITKDGRLDMRAFEKMLSDKVKLVAFTHMSNVLGTINPVADMIGLVRAKTNAVTLIDGAQSVPHFPVDVQAIGADFYVFSSHKMLGPSGVGVLHGRADLLEKMQPFLTGGDMILSVTQEGAEWNDIPWRFEAGTPNIEGVIGFGAAIDYLEAIGMEEIFKHEKKLTSIALEEIGGIKGVTIVGPQDTVDRGGAVSFTVSEIHPHDLASVFDEEGVAVRAGNHCAQPLHQCLGVTATARASFYIYNTKSDIDALVRSINKVKEIFGV